MSDDYDVLLGLARRVKQGGRDAWGVLSTGEKLAVAMILNRHDWLTEYHYTMTEALHRIGADWVRLLPRVAQSLIDEDAEGE